MPRENVPEKKDQELDPVTANAVAAAMAATERPKSSVWSKIGTWVAVFVALIATAAAIVGAVNSVNIRNTQDSLRKQQNCLISLIAQVQADGVARTKIAADDRKVIRDLVADITKAKKPDDVRKAFDKFNKASAQNDKNRSSILFKIPAVGNACNVKRVQATTAFGPTTINIPSSHQTPPTKGTTRPKASGSTKSPTQPAGSQPRNPVLPAPSEITPAPGIPHLTSQPAAPRPSPTPSRTHAPTPGPTTTVTKPVPGGKTTVTVVPSQPRLLPSLVKPVTSALCRLKLCF